MLRRVDLRLDGTAAARGWPEPGCPCASCSLAAAAPRAPLDVVLDGSPLPLRSGPVGDGSVLLALDDSCAVPSAPYAVVLLADADLALLARLRRCGAVGPATDVVAVGLTHRHLPSGSWVQGLADCGVRLLPDGSTLSSPAPAVLPRRTLVLGGARSGKSAEAERRVAGDAAVVYVATAPPRPGDEEWARRLRVHRERRPSTWQTLETVDLEPLLAGSGPTLLVDDLGLWLTCVMDAAGAWEGSGLEAVRSRVDQLVAAWRGSARRAVAVSPEVGGGVVPASRSGRLFRDELGSLNARLAAQSERVVQVVAGRVHVL